MNFLRKMWRFLDRWNTITGYLIGGVWLLFNGNFYNNGIADIRYVYFFNISGILTNWDKRITISRSWYS